MEHDPGKRKLSAKSTPIEHRGPKPCRRRPFGLESVVERRVTGEVPAKMEIPAKTQGVSSDTNGDRNNAEPSISLRERFQELLRTYAQERVREPFGSQTGVWSIFERIKVALGACRAVSSRKELMCCWGAGKGKWAEVPWIGILDRRETTSIQRGIYVVSTPEQKCIRHRSNITSSLFES